MTEQPMIFLDLETTGINSRHERIIEVGLCEVANGKLVSEWSSLVNPGKRISQAIEHLTGISNDLLQDQPTFHCIVHELRERLSGKLLVAHNARFDIGFLKNEFRREGIDFQEKVLCTVKLSRALYPQYKRHSLDELITRHGIQVQDRHRALGDAQAIQKFFGIVCQEHSPEAIAKAMQSQFLQPSLPPHLPKEQIERLPSAPGVYLLYGENEAILYVGKSVDIRSRVKSHFTGDHRVHKGMRLSQQVRRIDFVETAGELGALLLEARLVKELAPIHNRRLRRTRDLVAIRLVIGPKNTSRVELVSLKNLHGKELDGLYGMFRSRRQAETALREMVMTQGLCNRVLGLEKGHGGACFNFQIKKCRGACVGKEPLALHELRLINALSALKVRSWPFPGMIGIQESSFRGERTDVHVFDHWCHLGTADNENRLWELLDQPDPLPFDLDSYKILTRFLDKKVRPADVLDFSRPLRKLRFG